jgi:hypothetical protein
MRSTLRGASFGLAVSSSVLPLGSLGAQEKAGDTVRSGSLTVRVRHLTDPIRGERRRPSGLLIHGRH